MSLPYENRQQKNSLVAGLVAANTEDVEQIGLTPYQPILYAIPKDQREAEFQLLQRAANFQPELYRKIEALATRDELRSYINEMQNIQTRTMKQTVSELAEANSQTVCWMQRTIEQAGKTQEKFISDSSSTLATRTQELDRMIDGLQRKIIQIQICTAASAVMLSAIVSVVLWRLLG